MRCPHCGTPLRFFVEVAGEADVAPARTAARTIACRITDDDEWEIQCPKHGWSKAREWPRRGDTPPNVKCKAKTGDSYCDVRVPLDQARKSAEEQR